MITDPLLLAFIIAIFGVVGWIILRETSEADKQRNQEEEYLTACSGPYYGDEM